MFHQDMPGIIKSPLTEFSEVFSEDLPLGLPPICLGNQFEIELQDNAVLVHRPIYKISPMELAVAKEQIEYMLEHDTYAHPTHLWCCLHLDLVVT